MQHHLSPRPHLEDENTTDKIRVYNAMGALVCRDVACRIRAEITVNNTSVYIIKTGGEVKRVMVN